MKYHYSGEVKDGYSILDNVGCNFEFGSFEKIVRKGVKIFSFTTDINCDKWFEDFKINNPEAKLNLIDHDVYDDYGRRQHE